MLIQNKTTQKVVQTLDIPENNHHSINEEEFIVEDMNFDGFNDFRVLEYRPAFPNMPYYFYLFDPKQNKFVLQKSAFWTDLLKSS